jgi:hypothetical protein
MKTIPYINLGICEEGSGDPCKNRATIFIGNPANGSEFFVVCDQCSDFYADDMCAWPITTEAAAAWATRCAWLMGHPEEKPSADELKAIGDTIRMLLAQAHSANSPRLHS